jgi:RNA processing factor Prp31
MQNLKRYLEELIESKKFLAERAKKPLWQVFSFTFLSEDLIDAMQNLMEKALEKYEEREQAEEGLDDWKYNCDWYGSFVRPWEAK